MAANKKKREAAREAEKQFKEAAAAEEEEEDPSKIGTTADYGGGGDDDDAMDTSTAAGDALHDIAALQHKFGLGGAGSEFIDEEQVIFPVSDCTAAMELDQEEFTAAALASLQATGLQDTALSTLFQGESSEFVHAAFKQAVLSGVISALAVQTGSCADATVTSVFSLIAFSSDLQLAGAAFRTLMCIFREEASSEALFVDPTCGVVSSQKKEILISPQSVPSAATLLAAIKLNGYDPARAQNKDLTADLDSAAHGKNDHENEVEESLRVQTLKLLLHTVAAISRYSSRHPDAAALVLEPAAASELLLAVLHMGLDPAALRMQRNLDAACTALLTAISPSDWKSQILPQLAERVATLGPNVRSHLRVLRQLPSGQIAAARQLQRFAGCILVERILPGTLAPKTSAIPKRGAVPHPGDVLLSQPWFHNFKGVVSGASPVNAITGGKSNSNSATDSYTMAEVELLLHTCDLLLWPAALRSLHDISSCSSSVARCGAAYSSQANDDDDGDGDLQVMEIDATTTTAAAAAAVFDDEPLAPSLLESWCKFLSGLHGRIRALQPEDMAVKSLASRFEFKYRETVERPSAWGSSP